MMVYGLTSVILYKMTTQQFKLQNFETGLMFLSSYLKKQRNYSPDNAIPCNIDPRNGKPRYMLLNKWREKNGFENYLYMFKREPFYSFGDYILGRPETGETINKEELDKCITKNVKNIFVMYASGNLYEVSSTEWLRRGYPYHNKSDGKNEWAIPIYVLKRMNYEQEKILRHP